jgi:hypothetical protein
MVVNFRSFITEGGNLKLGDVAAEPMLLDKKHNRAERQQDIHDFLHHINNAHMAETGEHLFGPKGEAINSGSVYAGSTRAFMDPKIKDEEFVQHKPKVGDADIMVPEQHADTLSKVLSPGSRFGKYTIVGQKRAGSQTLTLARHDDGQVQQFDMEPSTYKNNEPSEWNQFSHSSDWGDVKSGVKGAFHKLLLSAMTSAHGRFGVVRSKKGDAEGFIPTHRFSVDRGMREGHEQIGTEDGKPIMREKTPKESTYTTDVPTIYQNMFNRKPTRQDVHDIGSFHGLLKHMNNYLSPEQRSRVIDKFVDNQHRQMIGTGEEEDMAVKNATLDHMRRAFPDHFTPQKEREIAGIQNEFYAKERAKQAKKVPEEAKVPRTNLKEAAPDFHIAGAAGRFNGPSVEHEKLLNNLFSQPAHQHYVFVMGPSTPEETTDKDPLTISEKIDRLKKVYPEKADSFIAGDHRHTKNPAKALAWMWHRHKDDGQNLHLTMVAGSGSTGVKNKSSAGGSSENYKGILDKYNGSRFPLTINDDGSRRGGDYRMNYASYNVVENPRGETSGSAVRAAARSLDHDNPDHVERFRQMLHSRTTPEDAQSLMQTIKARSKKKINENTTSGVGGLGYNTGNPAATQDEAGKYLATNQKTSNEINKSLGKQLSDNQNSLSKIIGFKAYNPSSVSRDSLNYWDSDENGDPLANRGKRRSK